MKWMKVYIVSAGLGLTRRRQRTGAALATGSCNATALPSETRDNAAKQLYWRLKRLGLESTPNNNINYNNNYMFIYTIYRLKNAML